MHHKLKLKNKFLSIGEILRENSSFKEALKAYQEALKYGNSSKAELGIAHSLRITGDFEGALKKYDEISKKYKDKKIYADSLLGKALSLKGLSNVNDALKILGKVEKIYEEIDDELGIANLYWAYAVTYRFKGEFGKSVDYGLKALSIFKYYDLKKGTLYSHCALGGVLRILGDLKESYKNYSLANKIAKELKDTFGIAYSYCGLGNYFRMKNEFKKALNYFKKAEKYYSKIQDITSFSYTLWSMGITFLFLKNYEKSFECFRKAFDNFEKTKDKRGIVYACTGLIQQKFLRKESFQNETKICKEIFKKYELKWEKLIFEILISKIKGNKMEFSKKISSFGCNYNFNKFPLNIP